MSADFTELAALAVDLNAFASHQSAGQVWRDAGMRIAHQPALPTLTVGRNRSRAGREGVLLHRRDLGPGATCLHNGVPVTAPLQTTVDLARELSFMDAVVTADSVLASRLVCERELIAAAAETRGRNSRNVRQVAAAADGRSQSVPESVMRLLLLQSPQVGRVVPQWRLCRDGHPYDIGLPDLRTVVEYQSWEWHDNRHVWRRDAMWGNLAQAAGWCYIQVVHEDLLLGAEHLAGLVLTA